jgi:hypothetical protein
LVVVINIKSLYSVALKLFNEFFGVFASDNERVKTIFDELFIILEFFVYLFYLVCVLSLNVEEDSVHVY